MNVKRGARLLTLFLIVLSCRVYALGKIDQTCTVDYDKCLKMVEQQLPHAPVNKIEYFKLKMFQLNALYYLGKYHLLYIELNRLLEAPRLPKILELKTHILSAKLAFREQDKSVQKKHLAKAKAIFEGFLATGEDPNILIDYANLHIYLKQYREGIEILQELERKFSKHKNANVLAKVAINLGNLYMHVGELEKAQAQYLIAMDKAKTAGLINVNITSNYNYGRTFQELGQNTKAIEVFLSLISQADNQVDSNISQLIYFRLGQLYAAEQNWPKAKLYLLKVESAEQSNSYKKQVNALMAIVNENLKGT